MLNRFKYPLIILLFFIIGCLIFKDIFFITYDLPRELLIPKGILEGKILYKEIYNFYGAIPYYIAALFFKLFEINTKTYFLLNAINSFLQATLNPAKSEEITKYLSLFFLWNLTKNKIE